jgi:hypothetical protein
MYSGKTHLEKWRISPVTEEKRAEIGLEVNIHPK